MKICITRIGQRSILLFFLIISTSLVTAEASLFSTESSFIRAMELQGNLNRSFMNYRSQNDEIWDEGSLSNQYPGLSADRIITNSLLSLRIFPVETFLSYNSDYPYGSNDRALWQGVGVNSLSSAGFECSLNGFSFVVKPDVYYSQNRDFDILESAYTDSDGYGYFWGVGLDEYQRPGDSYLFDWSWGDSEVRYTWQSFTLGFGTQSVWLGPGVNSSLILSDNAAPFPKLDFGMLKTSFGKWGDFELRAFLGQLCESEWFDDDSSNDKNSISVLAASWSPSFFPELTLGINRALLSKWDNVGPSEVAALFVPDLDTGHDESDQRFSLTGEVLLPDSGMRFWTEIGYNDFYRSWDSFIRYPFHTFAYNLGVEKIWSLGSPKRAILVRGEMSSTESSRDTAVYWPQTFYAHHIVTQGHTNEGQSLGAFYGSGGTFGRLDVEYIHPGGSASLYIARQNGNNDYIYFMNSSDGISVQSSEKDRFKLKAIFTVGTDTTWIIREGILFFSGFACNMVHNPLYENDDLSSEMLNSIHLYTGLKIKL